ncbi:MAG: hypothetical protein L6R42_004210, partial [Xanthoria sp. 1 TBL-2021]
MLTTLPTFSSIAPVQVAPLLQQNDIFPDPIARLQIIWRAQNLEAIDMIDEIEESMTKLGEYAGDNMVALELSHSRQRS